MLVNYRMICRNLERVKGKRRGSELGVVDLVQTGVTFAVRVSGNHSQCIIFHASVMHLTCITPQPCTKHHKLSITLTPVRDAQPTLPPPLAFLMRHNQHL
jgi:hypothetical protein